MILAQLTETRALMVLLALHYNKGDSNANVYLDGKGNFVKLILMTVSKNLVSLVHLVQI